MKSFEDDGVQIDTGSGYIRRPWSAVRYDGTGFTGHVYLGGERVSTASHKTLADARAELDEKIGSYQPAEQGRRVRFGERAGYYVVNEDNGDLSVWRYVKGEAIRHAGPCQANPYTARVSYLDQSAKDAKMFGSDWSYYVTDGKENLGSPVVVTQQKKAANKAKGKRTDMAEVNRLIAEGASVAALAARFKVAERTAYRWVSAAKDV